MRLGANALKASQIALQVTGQNIANANNPDYIREEVRLVTGPTQQLGGLLLGTGVRVDAVLQKLDEFLEARLRGAISERASYEAQEEVYVRLEQAIGELSDTDLSTLLNGFFSSISEIMNQPDSASVRNLAVLQGITLTSNINSLAERVAQMRGDVNRRVETIGEQINQLTEEIRVLNVRISQTEGGDVSRSDAVGLRDRRVAALSKLAELIDIRVEEQPGAGVAVYSGGEYLVFEGVRREVEVVRVSDRGVPVAEIRLAETDSPLGTTAGALFGLMQSRDEVLGGFLDRLDAFARTLAFEFNRVYSCGQGLNGFDELTSDCAVDANNLPLNRAGLPDTPASGSFRILLYDKQTGLTQTTEIVVDLDGLGEGDTTLASLARALDAVDGISAQADVTGKLTIRSDSANQQFAFADDTSGVLAALGMNTFFVGTTARGLNVNPVLIDDPTKFAASRSGIGTGTENLAADENGAPRLAAFLDRPIASQNGATIAVLYDRLVSKTVQDSATTQAFAEGARTYEGTLSAQKAATSGVNLDEEAIDLMVYQQNYLASARYISILHDLLRLIAEI